MSRAGFTDPLREAVRGTAQRIREREQLVGPGKSGLARVLAADAKALEDALAVPTIYAELDRRLGVPPGELTREQWALVCNLGPDVVQKIANLHIERRDAKKLLAEARKTIEAQPNRHGIGDSLLGRIDAFDPELRAESQSTL